MYAHCYTSMYCTIVTVSCYQLLNLLSVTSGMWEKSMTLLAKKEQSWHHVALADTWCDLILARHSVYDSNL